MAAVLPDNPTGADLADAIRKAAATRGVPLRDFLVPMWAGREGPTKLHGLERAKRPKPETIARVRELLAGEDLPPPRDYRRSGVEVVRKSCVTEAIERGARMGLARSTGTVVAPIDTFGNRPVYHQPARADDPRPPATGRDPCPWCNTRGDLGCRHQRPMEAA